MRNFKVSLLLVLTALFGVSNVHAGLIEFDTCLTQCDDLDASFLETVNSIATLEFADNGSGGVDFILTNSVANAEPGNNFAFLSQLHLDFLTAPTGSSNESSSIDFISIADNAITTPGLQGWLFDVEVNLANRFPLQGERLLDGQSASFTLLGVSAADLEDNNVVLVQRLLTDDGPVGAARLSGSLIPEGNGGPVQQAPEPGTLALFVLAGLGFVAGRRKLA